jgi:ubiquitin-conjugating enzyme E2 variant
MNIFLQFIIGLFIADFLSGFFHWFEDNYFDYNNSLPILSKIAKDNELHHYYPRGITHEPYINHT